ncbi:MAG: hypothetical protein V4488_00205 [Pseudomonadota bacterium]
MNAPIAELKTRARLLLNALDGAQPQALARAQQASKKRRWPVPETWQLKHCLNIVAAEAGFSLWDHARAVLGGEARAGDDMGDFWCDAESAVFLNHWYADYQLALDCLHNESGRFLLPYRRQFVVAGEHYVRHLGLLPNDAAWQAIGYDLVAGYGSAGWLQLCEQRLQARRPASPQAKPLQAKPSQGGAHG